MNSNNSYVIRASDATNALTVNQNCNTSINENLDVSKVLNLQRHPTESDTIPLVITYTSSSGSGFIGKFVSTVKGCLFEYLMSASSTAWWQGILRGSNEFVIKFIWGMDYTIPHCNI